MTYYTYPGRDELLRRPPPKVIDEAIKLLRAAWRDDGAEGESVHMVCREVEELRARLAAMEGHDDGLLVDVMEVITPLIPTGEPDEAHSLGEWLRVVVADLVSKRQVAEARLALAVERQNVRRKKLHDRIVVAEKARAEAEEVARKATNRSSMLRRMIDGYRDRVAELRAKLEERTVKEEDRG